MQALALHQSLPHWSLEALLDGDPPESGSFLGKPLLILIFSLGCPGCVGRAIPFANRMAYEYGEQLSVLGVHANFDGVDFTLEQFQEAKEEYYIRFPFYRDQNYVRTFLRYGAGGTPHWVLVDQQGKVAYSIFGSDPNNALLRLDLRIKEVLEGE